MEHVPEDDLALAALGESLSGDARAHLASCATCQDEVASFAAVVAHGRAVTPDDAMLAPADEVWERIRTEIAGDTNVVPITAVRRRPRWYLAAAAGLVIGAAGGVIVADRVLGDDPAPTIVAEVRLDALPDWPDSSGTARVEVDASGARSLVVNLDGTTVVDGFQEVWLIDRDVTRLVSLGVLEGTEARLPIPASVDLDVYAVVDVSAEPLDGAPAHSGDSIVRGIIGA